MRTLLLLLALTASAGAASVPFVQVLQQTPGVTRVTAQDGEYRLTLQPRAERPMTMFIGLGRNTAYPGQHLTLRGISKSFSGAQLAVLEPLLWNVASSCFNVRADRRQALAQWLRDENSLNNHSSEDTMFGPLHAYFERGVQEDGNTWALLSLHREQVPGVAPWLNTCKP